MSGREAVAELFRQLEARRHHLRYYLEAFGTELSETAAYDQATAALVPFWEAFYNAAGMLAAAPTADLEHAPELYRIHGSVHGPVWFCCCGTCRFDPVLLHGERGACYTALQPLGAFVEVFGRLRTVRQEDLDGRTISTVQLNEQAHVLDLTDRALLGDYGLTADVQAGTDYLRTQVLASALVEAGFDGILYAARHDPGLRTRSVAVFGKLDDSDKNLIEGPAETITEELVSEAHAWFGIKVVPSTFLLP